METRALRLVLYGENPLALRYLARLLRPARPRILSWSSVGTKPIENCQSEFILIADEGSHDSSKQKLLQLVQLIGENARILVIGDTASASYIRLLIHRGVHGFILYKDVESQLRSALTAIRKGHLWMPVEAAERSDQALGARSPLKSSLGQPLTSQETVVLNLLARNLSNKEIGNHLCISERTVKFHVSNILDRLGVRDRHSAVSLANPVAISSPTIHKGLLVVTRDGDEPAQPLTKAAKAGQQ